MIQKVSYPESKSQNCAYQWHLTRDVHWWIGSISLLYSRFWKCSQLTTMLTYVFGINDKLRLQTWQILTVLTDILPWTLEPFCSQYMALLLFAYLNRVQWTGHPDRECYFSIYSERQACDHGFYTWHQKKITDIVLDLRFLFSWLFITAGKQCLPVV